MAARKSKLGADFWGNFYRLDTDKHAEEIFRNELACVGVQTVLEAPNGTTISMATLVQNLNTVKEHMRRK